MRCRRDILLRFIPHIYIGEGFNFNAMAFQRANKVVEGNRRIYFYRRNNPTSATTKFRLDKWENAKTALENSAELTQDQIDELAAALENAKEKLESNR